MNKNPNEKPSRLSEEERKRLLEALSDRKSPKEGAGAPVKKPDEARRPRRAVRYPNPAARPAQQAPSDSPEKMAAAKQTPPARSEAPSRRLPETARPAMNRSTSEEKRPLPARQNAPAKAPVVREKKPKKKKISPFFLGTLITFLVLTVALIIGLLVLRSVLAAYEDSQPIHKAEELFDNYFETRDFEKVVELAKVESTTYETPQEIAALMRAASQGKDLILYPVASGENEANYAVSLVEPEPSKNEEGDSLTVQTVNPVAKLATMYFARNEEPGKYGFYSYHFVKLKIELSGKESVKVRIPSDYTLFVNGREIPKNGEDAFLPTVYNDFLPAGVPGVYYTEYQFTGLYLEPVLSCRNSAGETVEMQKGEDGVVTAPLTYSEELKEQHSAFIIAGVKAYMARMSDDGGLGAVSRYWDTTSAYYRQIRENPSVFVWDHNGCSFKDAVTENFLKFDDNTFCCHVKLTQLLHMNGREDFTYQFDEILFLKKNAQGYWGIYNHVLEGAVKN